jgi:hypothetical protein
VNAKRYLLLVVWVFVTADLPAQVTGNPVTGGSLQTLQSLEYDVNWHMKMIDVIPYDQIQGSPYYKPEFEECLVYLTDGKVARAIARYDMYADEMQFSNSGKIYRITKENVDSIVFGTERFVCRNYLPDDKTKTSYFILLSNGRYQLLLKRSVRFLQKEPARPYIKPEPDRFDDAADSYFIKSPGKQAAWVYNQKSLEKAFPEIGGKANSYIRSEKIKFTNPSDLIRLMKFLNSLN